MPGFVDGTQRERQALQDPELRAKLGKALVQLPQLDALPARLLRDLQGHAMYRVGEFRISSIPVNAARGPGAGRSA